MGVSLEDSQASWPNLCFASNASPELMIRMLIVGDCIGISSERRLCDEVHLNLAYCWFCQLGLDGDVPDHSTFSKKNRQLRSQPFGCDTSRRGSSRAIIEHD